MPSYPHPRPLLVLAVLVLVIALPLPARAELVVLTNGNHFKVTSFELEGDRMRLDLFHGGQIILPLGRIERVVDDEVLPEPEPLPEPPAPVIPDWSFIEAEGVPDTPYGAEIHDAARRHAVSAALVAAMVRHESAFDPRAVSHKGARGLMQLMPATADRFGVKKSELFMPERNLEAGVSYLKWLLDRYDELPSVLAAYNAGEGTVDRYKGVPPYRETRDYIRRIYRTLGLEEAASTLGVSSESSAASVSRSR